jgi:membrane protein
MALYLSTAAVVSAYGAAGSLVVILMWIYFSSAVLLLSASMARAWCDEAAKSDAANTDSDNRLAAKKKGASSAFVPART